MKTRTMLKKAFAFACLLASISAPSYAQWVVAAPNIFTAAATPFVGHGIAAPQDRLHIHTVNPNVPFAVARISTDFAGCLATSQFAMEPNTGGPPIFSAVATPGDLVIRTMDDPAIPAIGVCAEDVIIAARTNGGMIRLTTTPVFPGADVERVTVIPNGNVGIGNVAPTALLHVGIGTGARINLGSTEFMRDGGVNHLMLGAPAGLVTPSDDCATDLGSATLRWAEVFACNGVINTSDLRQKDNIRDIPYGLSEVMKLRPVSFTWKDKSEDGTKLGVIAQEVQKVLPEVVKDPAMALHYDELGNLIPNDPNAPLGVYYSDMIPVLIKAIQEQQQKIAELEARLAVPAENSSTPSHYEDILLEQNNPNPFSESTSIMYFIPSNIAGAVEVVVADAGGTKVLQRYPAAVNTPQQVTISAKGLETGVYVYGVAVNGRIVTSKKMMIMK